jgi:ATP-dependent exoDNAse (exonuclease V) alpha subunit
LAGTKQMHAFLERPGPDDRVLLVGDVRQHEAVDAGRPYHQLQEARICTAHLDEIVRQRDPELKTVVEDSLAHILCEGVVSLFARQDFASGQNTAQSRSDQWPSSSDQEPSSTPLVLKTRPQFTFSSSC